MTIHSTLAGKSVTCDQQHTVITNSSTPIKNDSSTISHVKNIKNISDKTEIKPTQSVSVLFTTDVGLEITTTNILHYILNWRNELNNLYTEDIKQLLSIDHSHYDKNIREKILNSKVDMLTYLIEEIENESIYLNEINLSGLDFTQNNNKIKKTVGLLSNSQFKKI